MDKNAIKKYAVWARRELITRVDGQAARYGITEDGWININADNVEGRVLSDTEKKQRVAFIEKVRTEGYEQAVEEVAYTWFNRFCALRYMEVNAYLPSHVRIFTNDAGEFKPQILDEALHLDLDGLDMNKVLMLKEDANQTEELFRYLLITQCNSLSSILPGMFQKIEDYTELLLPENLLREGSVIERLITEIPEEDWTDQVQIIGWLYQYYNAEKKDEVFAALKKNVKITKENIPAATQLFTPDWIVRYMVENSLGRLWVEGHPNEELKSNWKYYLDEAEQEPEVEVQLVEIHKEYAALKPEDIKCIDPCCGSGHILVYMFDVLIQIYKSYGYTVQEAVNSIVENNLYGLDIDERAAQLAYFSVMMKARSYDRRFFSRSIQPHVYAIREAIKADYEYLEMFGPYSDTVKKLLDSFIDAKEYGSLIEPDISIEELDALEKHMGEMDEMSEYGGLNSELFTYLALNAVWPFLEIAKLLVQKYDVVATNPPYMNSGSMDIKLMDYLRKNFTLEKYDLYAALTRKTFGVLKPSGFQAIISQQGWMYLSTYERFRKEVLISPIINMIHLGAKAFDEISGEIVQTVSYISRKIFVNNYKGKYFRLVDELSPKDKKIAFLAKEKLFLAEQRNFEMIPGNPIAYWVSNTFVKNFENPKLGEIAKPRSGLSTNDNNRFLRFWFEIKIDKFVKDCCSIEDAKKTFAKWFPYNKGGKSIKWYGNFDYVVNWENDGEEIKYFAVHNPKDPNTKHWTRRASNYQMYFRRAITWSLTNGGTFAARIRPEGSIFDMNGMSLFCERSLENYILALMCSKTVNYYMNVFNPTLANQAGDIAKIPFILDLDKKEMVDLLTSECINIAKTDWDSFETSWDFHRHPLIGNSTTISDAFFSWKGECDANFTKLKYNEEELNRIFISIYGLQNELTPEVEDKDLTVRKADLQWEIKSLISYAVGCMFGRYSLDMDGLAYAGGEWDTSKYQSYQPDYNGILPICDDEYFTDDIVGHFVDFIRTVYGEDTLEENLQFIAEALGGSGSAREVIRKYFLNDFYKDHCKIYQKRPIYWMFDSGKKNGFKCLIYLHRYRPDTIARIRTDYVHEQQARYRTAISELDNRILGASTSESIKLKKTLMKLQDQADELIGYEEKIHHLADQFIDINLDDGVKVNYAKFQDVLAKIR